MLSLCPFKVRGENSLLILQFELDIAEVKTR